MMNFNLWVRCIGIFVMITVFSCSNADNRKNSKTELGLKGYYSDIFDIGIAVTPSMLNEHKEFILTHFSSVTAENAMKMAPLHPEPDSFYWATADHIVEFAQQNNLKVRGHVLVWHEQVPAWFFDGENGSLEKNELLTRMENHITTIANRYKGKVYCWDVVNEAIDDDSINLLRKTPWTEIIGEEFIAKAFDMAHKADPDAELFYNDYNIIRPEKVERTYALLKKLVDNGVPIHGIGIQAHWSVFEPSEDELRYALDKYTSLGLKVHITELDISLYPWEKHRRKLIPGEEKQYDQVEEQKQIEQYKMVFRVFRDYRDHIESVTFWGLHDGRTWLDYYPVRGRNNFPTLFNDSLQPKKVYWELINF